MDPFNHSNLQWHYTYLFIYTWSWFPTQTCSVTIIIDCYIVYNVPIAYKNYNQPTYCCVDGPSTNDNYIYQDTKYNNNNLSFSPLCLQPSFGPSACHLLQRFASGTLWGTSPTLQGGAPSSSVSIRQDTAVRLLIPILVPHCVLFQMAHPPLICNSCRSL